MNIYWIYATLGLPGT